MNHFERKFQMHELAAGNRNATKPRWAIPMIALLLITNVSLGSVGVMLDFRPNYPDIPVAPLVYWNDFLQTGGPLALAIAASILVVSAADRWIVLSVSSK